MTHLELGDFAGNPAGLRWSNEKGSPVSLKVEDIDWFVPHQANIRILESVAKKVGLSEDKIIITVQKHANTSAASIPLALFDAVQEGKIKKGDLVLLEAMGGGFSWGSTLIRW